MRPDSTNSAGLSTGTKTICKVGRREKAALT